MDSPASTVMTDGFYSLNCHDTYILLLELSRQMDSTA